MLVDDDELPDGPWLALAAAVVKGCDPEELAAWQSWAESALPPVRVPRNLAGHGLGAAGPGCQINRRKQATV